MYVCMYVICVILTISRDCFPTWYEPTDLFVMEMHCTSYLDSNLVCPHYLAEPKISKI